MPISAGSNAHWDSRANSASPALDGPVPLAPVHSSGLARPKLIYDGSDDAKHAIERAGGLLRGRPALVVTVWQPTAALGSFAWSGATASMVNFVELDRAAAEDGDRVAREGVRIAQEAGLEAEPVAIKGTGPVWKTILKIADLRDAAAIVMGSRGLTGLGSMLPGSVSSAVMHHADHPTLVIHRLSENGAEAD